MGRGQFFFAKFYPVKINLYFYVNEPGEFCSHMNVCMQTFLPDSAKIYKQKISKYPIHNNGFEM